MSSSSNGPDIIGTLLYVRVVKANPGMNPELSCTDASGKAAEFGQLKDGYMFESSTGLSRMLLSSPTCPVLDALGKKLSFETAVGLNGRVWVNASSPPSTVIVVANAIMNSESLSGVQQRIMAEKLIQNLKLSSHMILKEVNAINFIAVHVPIVFYMGGSWSRGVTKTRKRTGSSIKHQRRQSFCTS
uniref:K Homology domain-containing protein n=1 Tax=Quercus lobata TaxID=97700 RepID=A0A7N2R0E6_QUELO